MIRGFARVTGLGLVLALLPAPAAAQSALVDNYQGTTVFELDDAMNSVFGSGGWSSYNFETADGTTLFSSAFDFVYLRSIYNDGGTSETFLNTHSATIYDWVHNGGRLVLNNWSCCAQELASPFGVSLIGQADGGEWNHGAAVDPGHALFQDYGWGATGSSWQGNYFAHNMLSGTGFETFVVNGAGESIVGGMQVGSGYVMFTGLTDAYYHYGNPAGADALDRNIIHYTSTVPTTEVVPEPITMVLLGSGLVGIGGAARRRRRKELESGAG